MGYETSGSGHRSPCTGRPAHKPPHKGNSPAFTVEEYQRRLLISQKLRHQTPKQHSIGRLLHAPSKSKYDYQTDGSLIASRFPFVSCSTEKAARIRIYWPMLFRKMPLSLTPSLISWSGIWKSSLNWDCGSNTLVRNPAPIGFRQLTIFFSIQSTRTCTLIT